MATSRDYLGTFRLIRLIRVGATCQVWEAVSDSGGDRVAIKALQPEVRTDRDEIAFLKHEHEVGKGLKHPNVIEVYDFHTDREIPFLVLELSTAKNMKLVLREGVEKIFPIMHKVIKQAAEGLSYFHNQGWIHRDVKPDNFLVSDQGDVKLIDFALAIRQRTGLGKLLPTKTKVQGTRSYMAPEQIRGKALDARADIYSFGCMLYEMMSGKLPYTGATPEDLLKKHLWAQIPSVATSNSNITTEFNALIMKMMAKDAKERPASMEDFLTKMSGMRIFRVTPKPVPEAESEDENEGTGH